MMEAVDKTADTVKSIGYAVFHPKKTAKEAAKTIKATAEEKGGSYVGGYVLGEAAQAAALAGAGSTVKAAKATKLPKNTKKKYHIADTTKESTKNSPGKVGKVKGGTVSLKPDELVVRDTKFLDADGNIDWDTWAPLLQEDLAVPFKRNKH